VPVGRGQPSLIGAPAGRGGPAPIGRGGPSMGRGMAAATVQQVIPDL